MAKLICIAGPTASGKTAFAVSLAKALNAEVVNCDSMQIYKYMDIGTAKPTKEEMQGIPHHMIDVAEPWEDYSVSRYCETASPIIDRLLTEGRNVIVAGGTGLYMDSLIRGNAFAPCPSTGVREELEKEADYLGMEAMLERLRTIDPEAAARLHLSDRKRIIRALEVYLETGKTITQHNLDTQALPPKYSPIWFGLDFENRQDLYYRIDARVECMLQAGLVAEIQSLLDRGIPKKCTAMQAIGYKEFLQAMDGEISLRQAADQVAQSSRRYAKRQLTWFRRNTAIHWLVRTPATATEEITQSARQILREIDN